MNNTLEADLSLTQKVAILLLGANCSEPLKGKLWYQKEIFLIAQNIPELKEETEFEPDFIGPYSEIAEEELEHLRYEGIVTKEKEKLTATGENVKNKIEKQFPDDTKLFVAEIKAFLNDLTKDEMLGFIYYTYPTMRLESIEFQRISTIRKPIAISLFKKGKISLGKAADIAGLSQEELIETLRANGIKVYSA